MTRPPSLGDRFVLKKRIAVSGMSEVWLADDLESGHEVAVKRPTPELDPSLARAAIEREVLALGRLDHPSIPTLIDRSDAAESPFIVMEWREGVLLKTLRGRPVEELLPVLIDLSEALEYAHQKAVIHRDLKPGNVIVDPRGRPTLIDFGISALMDSDETLVRGGGTRGHASPQQLAGEPPQPADDLYAFGALIVDLLEGGEFIDSPETVPPEGVERVLRRSVHPVPTEFEGLVAQLLAPRPEERPQGFIEVKRRLENIRREQFERTRPPAPVPFKIEAPVAPPPPPAPLQVKPILPPNRSPQRGGDPTPQGRAGTVVVVAILALVLIFGLVAVFWVLPQWVANRPSPGSPGVVETTTVPSTDNGEAIGIEATLQQAEEAWRNLTARSVGLWAPERSRELKTQLEASRELVKTGSNTEAVGALEDLLASFAELNDLAATVAEQTVAQAQGYLDAGNASAARESFQRALLVDPEINHAHKGLQDATNLGEALRALERGGESERAGNLGAAAEQYRIAKNKAPWFREAGLALSRVKKSQRETDYGRVLSKGLAALEAGEWERAETALLQAGALNPGAVEVEDALVRLEARRRLEKIERLQLAAGSFETQEDWTQAASTYSKILELTPASLAAEQGRKRAIDRTEIDVRFKGHLAHPERLSETAVLNDARSLLATVSELAVPGSRLEIQLNQLNHLVQQMSTPVHVEIFSDGQTEVTIYRVGRLGRFESRVVELTPGSYTVLGTRAGFRDVRLTLNVPVGDRPAPFSVLCEEAL